VRRAKAVLEGVTGGSTCGGNAIEVLRNGDQIFPAMLASVEAATSTVDLLTYVYWKGDIASRMATALCDRARAGVRVRIILDAVGCLAMDRDLVAQMEEAGCHVEWFRAAGDRPSKMNHRTHRKLLICDESVAMTGGVGIAEEWEGDARHPGEWRDTHFRVRGPAVRRMEAAFIEHWVECGHPSFTDEDRFPEGEAAGDVEILVLRGSSGPAWHDVGLTLDVLLRLAERSINLTTAYFVPGERMIELFCQAAARGVRIRLLLPGTHMDKRLVQVAASDDYERLLEAGVEIHHYEKTMLHAKCMTVDGEVALVGSANVDERSMRHNEELGLIVFDEGVVAELDGHFADDLRSSEPIDLERWRERPLWRRALETLVSPVEDLL
jgi:cardiolipin synthase A/B